ncbi:MAG: septal ring lytic transglycosylase RlpA family protein [Gammaproteobacteria bacterium]|nr:septal ring lytic transglycosylase RlpA family protein [Gammaproteobacteria bacterium]
MKPGFDRMRPLLPALLLAALAGCAGAPDKKVATPPARALEELAKIPDAVPKVEPKSELGNMKTYEVFGQRYYVLDSSDNFTQEGIASWYGPKFHGKKTSSGEIYDMYAMTAAHKTLPLPCYLEVENLENGRTIVVRVNDRGPFHDNRIVDLSYTAALKLDMLDKGTALVKIRTLDPRTHRRGGAPVQRRASAAADGAPVEGRALAAADAAPVEGRALAAADAAPLEFYIQVGVFADYNNAESLKDRLAALAAPIRVDEARLNETTAYRVKIGPLNNIEAADELVNQLAPLGIHEHRILLE